MSNSIIEKELSLNNLFILICQKKWQEIIVNNISNITKEQWLAVRLCKETEQYYWDLVYRDLLPIEMIYCIENECINIHDS